MGRAYRGIDQIGEDQARSMIIWSASGNSSHRPVRLHINADQRGDSVSCTRAYQNDGEAGS